MSTRGTRESHRGKPATQVAPEKVWVAVNTTEGVFEEVRAFRTEGPAQKLLSKWRKKMNPDYDEADIFEVPIEDAPAK